ncbi:Cytochrome c oxidase subunit 5A [Pichia californica]|uniref:Cytochrome c oxidase subunit 5A n=1 Tax=Pichia californica TaxID=460514 RepID=A0A9P7BH81_9ASCO|nr:Cytochrome c oxidase subunit 5A [[Candida] californica]KAG0690170.1 Cytochrome c oxidase subunit 5A [[Candida] californica]
MFRQLAKQSISNVSKCQTRFASTSITPAAISNLQGRWEKLPESDKQNLIEALSEKQKLPWTTLSLEEKKAAWYISFGTWGPRRPMETPEDSAKIYKGIAIGFFFSAALFIAYYSQRTIPRTMNKEWQEQSDEYLASKNSNPFSTYSQVQSK